MYPVLFKLGPLTVHSFGVMVAAGFLAGTFVAVSETRRRGGDGDAMWNMLVWVFLSGLLGARLLSLAGDLDGLAADPVAALLSGGGFVWYGGLGGGVVAALVLSRRYKLELTTVFEASAPALAIGQAIGRLGCHLAGDGDWGRVTELPWGVAYDNAIVGWPHGAGVVVHPAPIYEALAYAGICAGLLGLARKRPPVGTVFAAYLVTTGIARFLIEFIRVNPELAWGLTQAQWIAGALVLGGSLWLARRAAALPVVLAGVLTVTLLGACDPAAVSTGARVPGFVLPRIEGGLQSLDKLRGRPVLINHWATWCPPCIEELPVLNRIARDYGPRGLVVLGLAADEDVATVRRFLANHEVDFEVLLDASGAVGTEYGLTGYPETFLVDRDGRLVSKVVGPIPAIGDRPGAEFARAVEALLGG